MNSARGFDRVDSLPDIGFPGGFSVLMAVYIKDDAHLLGEAVNSVMSNTLRPDQFIIVADGPLTLGLDITLQSLNIRYENFIQIINLSKNIGLANALNAGLGFVKFPWVARADPDDINLPHRFNSMAKLLAFNPGVELMSASILEIDELKNPICVRQVPESEREIKTFLRYRNPFNHMAAVYSLAAVNACGGYPDIYLKEDYALWSVMISRGIRVVNTKDILVHATAGKRMYMRRGGWRYAKAEIDIQRVLVRDGSKGLLEAVFTGLIRSAIFLAPSFFRSLIYKYLLRTSIFP